MALQRVTAGAVVIGDEILTGKTLDTNTNTLAKYLFERGVVLRKTETILDDVDTIAETVRRLSNSHDIVFTSGGIGPTLDDVTYEGVAKAFDLPLARHEETLAKMRAVSPNMELNEARLRMAALPRDCETFFTPGLWVPLCCISRKVYVFPGIPRLFQRMLPLVPAARLGGITARARRIVYTEWSEGDLAACMAAVATACPELALGSYPATTEESRALYRTKLTLEGDDAGAVHAVAETLAAGVEGRIQP